MVAAGLNIALLSTYFYSFIKPCSCFLALNMIIIGLPFLIFGAYQFFNQTELPLFSGFKKTQFLGIGFVIGILIIRFGPINQEKIKLENIWETYLAQPIVEIPEDSTSPLKGNISAPIKLYVFSSFQCPYCKVFAFSMQYLHQQHTSNLAMIFKHFPLSSKCNDAIKTDLQPLSCNVAIAAIFAHNENKFWPFHDNMFATDLSYDYEDISTIFNELNLDTKFIEEEIDPTSYMKKISDDIELAKKLKVEGTPSVFINNRKTPTTDLSSLNYIIYKLLEID